MAVDEVLLESASLHGAVTLRFYSWSAPTLTLGYFQSYADRALHSASAECDVVRRCSGGGAIVHDHELTYSFATPCTDRFLAKPEQLYFAFHETLTELLGRQHVPARLHRGKAAPGRGSLSVFSASR